jgi:hypothetical protein
VHLSSSVARAAAVALVAALSTAGSAGSAQGKGGEVGGSGSDYFLYGSTTDKVYVGDWNNDGVDSLVVRRGNVYHFRNSLSGGPADLSVSYGRTTDTVLVGDWNGDGLDTLAVRRGNIYHFKDDLGSGPADYQQAYGRNSDLVLVGDWDGNGADTLATRRGNVYYIKNDFSGGAADIVLAFGRATDSVLTGDWNGDQADTLGVRRPPPQPVSFGAGTYQVGVNLPAGTYRSNSNNEACYWERLAGFSGTFDDLIANGLGPRPIVSVSPSDAGFYTDADCGTWTSVWATYPSTPLTSFGDGTFVVGKHIAPGTYVASSPSACYWERLSGFSGEFEDVIANDFEGASVVTIAESDAGFAADDCGTWQRV